MIIGAHVKLNEPFLFYGSVIETQSYNANALMIYTGAPQNTVRKPVENLRIFEGFQLIKDIDFTIIVHAPYVINLASPEKDKRNFAISFLIEEMKRADAFNAKYIVVHPGSFTSSSLEEGISNIIKSLNEVLKNDFKTLICIETMAGKGSEVGFKFEQIKSIINGIKKEIGVCFDTCHVHDAGYDLVSNYNKVFTEFDKVIGLDKLKVLHINDSMNPCGSKKDRHSNIGKGYIGLDVLKNIVNDPKFINVPKILETPYIDGVPPYKEEIELLTK